ncbi:MAG: YicC/YloC family endoribonuclease [Tepidimonas sp.]|uniref:YicC/YloC family endoribonuclease n=1 Tax=Tepidimonas sp. TaxID=2002775 RepID=UPI00259DFFB8|nr:YicC/YloC family endoribonuclease [Tepidimonas sp.]MDM7457479.1 YicC/YloC family endoribonuclease [Tepidimonas sp.]
MPVYSMTGYATGQCLPRAAASDDRAPGTSVLGLEIRAVNGRFLDLSLRLPEDLRMAEPALRERVGARVRRGKVELRVWIEQRGDGGMRVPTVAELQRLLSAQERVQAWLTQARALSVAEVLQLAQRGAPVTTDWIEPLLALAERVLDDFTAAREREGARLVCMLRDRVAQLRGLAAQAEPLVPQIVAQQRERFVQRIQDALGATAADPAAAQERALVEAAAFAVRVDVAEELTRLQSHLSEIERLLQRGGEVGKRLDFLIQELHREANTLGAKSASLELTRLSVDMKVLIEQMREQVQNLE